MTDEILTDIDDITLPYGKRVVLREVEFASGMKMTRLVFFEGKRVTQIDLDDLSAQRLGAALCSAARN